MTKIKAAIPKGFNFAWESYKAHISAGKQGNMGFSLMWWVTGRELATDTE